MKVGLELRDLQLCFLLVRAPRLAPLSSTPSKEKGSLRKSQTTQAWTCQTASGIRDMARLPCGALDSGVRFRRVYGFLFQGSKTIMAEAGFPV